MTLLLKEKQAKKCFSLNTETGKFEVAYKDKKIELNFVIKNFLLEMVDYHLNEKEFLRITKIHNVTIKQKQISCRYM